MENVVRGMKIMNEHHGFPYIHLLVTQSCVKRGAVPVNKVSMLRGVIGKVLKSQVCHDFKLNCRECDFENTCIYPKLFESPSQLVDRLNRGGTVPHPYIIRCHDFRSFFDEGDQLQYEIIFLGNQSEHFASYFLQVLDNIETNHFGKERVSFTVEHVTQLVSDQESHIYSKEVIIKPTISHFNSNIPSYKRVLIHSVTPYRFIKKKKLLSKFDLNTFLWQVNHRYYQLQFLNQFIEQKDESVLPLPEIKSEDLEILDEKMISNARFSNKQQKSIRLDGLKATVKIGRSKELDEWLPYLLFAELFHVGKSTTFGMGQYELWIS